MDFCTVAPKNESDADVAKAFQLMINHYAKNNMHIFEKFVRDLVEAEVLGAIQKVQLEDKDA